jgi:hypothetical protein
VWIGSPNDNHKEQVRNACLPNYHALGGKRESLPYVLALECDRARPLGQLGTGSSRDLPRSVGEQVQIKALVLYPYTQAIGVYRCPADKSQTQTTPPKPRLRSYLLEWLLNGGDHFGHWSSPNAR